jgi:nucleotide-binding universal stress UspA family protein
MSGANPAPGRPHGILMATDLSARCDRALDRAIQLSRQWQVPLHVVHAAPREAVGAWPAVDTPASIRQRIERELHDDVADASVHVEEGEPAAVILDVARRGRCDLIVLGDASEMPGRRLLGSTVETLVRSSPTSVLVVKRRPRGAYRRVLVGTDLTPESRHGLDTAVALFPQAQWTLLHALDIPYESLWLDPARRTDLTRMEMATIEAFVTGARLPADLRRRMQLLVEHGHPESMLRKHALEQDSDLTVIGAFRRGLAFHLLVGGTTRRIVQVAPNDVLVVRAQTPPDAGRQDESAGT